MSLHALLADYVHLQGAGATGLLGVGENVGLVLHEWEVGSCCPWCQQAAWCDTVRNLHPFSLLVLCEKQSFATGRLERIWGPLLIALPVSGLGCLLRRVEGVRLVAE